MIESLTLRSLLSKRFDRKAEVVHDRHKKKLFNLWSQQSKMSPDCITNISSRTLTIHERNALQFGLHHHILPKSFDKDLVKVNIEQMVDTAVWKTKSKVDFDLREDIKRCYFDFERQGKKICLSRKNQHCHRTLLKLAKDKSICVCSYDKGTGVVIMNSSDYHSKLKEILQDGSKFVEIDVDDSKPKLHPIVSKQNSIKYYVNKYIPEEDWKSLKQPGSQPGKLYGLCKVHKDNFPMRPIVSMINTPEYNLSKYLDTFIKPNIPERYMLKSTNEFLSKIKAYPLSGGEQMVSYDVVSLFTNVPLSDTIDIIVNFVYGEGSVVKPPFDEDTFRKMLRKCSQCYFLFDDVLYQQIDGVSMGGPLAPSMANAFLAHLENNLLNSNSTFCVPKLFLRYVDDCFALFDNEEDADIFLSILNNLHPSLKFTLERGNICMPFLDVCVKIEEGTFATSVYRKNTHTGVFLNFVANAPTAWKKGVIMCLLYRAQMICSDISRFNDEVNNLRKMFTSNSYPVKFFNSVLGKFLNKPYTASISDDGEEAETHCVLLKVPFLGKCSMKFASDISNIISRKFPVKVRVVYTTFKVKSYFRLKCFSPLYLSSNVVYRLECMSDSCTDAYIGYTIRHLYERCDEHLNFKKKQQSEIKDHIRNCSCCKQKDISYRDFSILRRCQSETHAKLFEAFFIKRMRPTLNKQLFAQGASKILHIWK